MFYPLSSVHKLIYESIHPETISQRSALAATGDIWQKVKQETEESRLHLFSQLSQAKSGDSLKVFVYTCQAGYVTLIKRLDLYISQHETKQGADPSGMREQYASIRQLLITHLNELYKQYFPFF